MEATWDDPDIKTDETGNCGRHVRLEHDDGRSEHTPCATESDSDSCKPFDGKM